MNNMINKNVLQILIQVIGWGIIFCFPLFFASKEWISWQSYLGYFFVPVAFMFVFYSNYFLLIDRLLFRKKLWQFILLNILVILLVEVGLDEWMDYYNAHFTSWKPTRPHPPKSMFVIRDYALMILVAALSVAIKMTVNWYRLEAGRKESEKRRIEAELKNLKSQLNPHFLFNTLNNIYSLISFSPEKAQHAVHDLSRLLRYVLYEDSQHSVLLIKEIEFINNYIALMKIRLSQQVKVETDISIESNMTVAPLLFITLIENAFKHGVDPMESSFIRIHLRTEQPGRIICRIENSFFPKRQNDKSGSGIGLENLRKRLELLYPGRHRLKTEVTGNTYIAELQIEGCEKSLICKP
ncbi:sensor histidine kinase [Odoribacter lunatus]|uniref:sensor histidine kinase n=1 Tax=Odoribacter lunatus TaxID=2941335 RepID=UPI00203C30B1|nr:histidine kinase [Odoribacter lunatus]